MKEGFSITRSHILCSPVQGPLCSLIILKLEYLGRVFGEILIWIPWAGTERVHLSVVELLAHRNILGGVKLACQYFGGYHGDSDSLEDEDKAQLLQSTSIWELLQPSDANMLHSQIKDTDTGLNR